MTFSSSQILSNFKLFSKNDDANVGVISTEKTFNYPIVFAFFTVALLCVFYYFKRSYGIGLLNDLVSNLWLKSHLNTFGELESTYVPKDFFAKM